MTTIQEQLAQYARETAADCGVDYATAVRMIDDEPAEVASDLRCTVDEVQGWVDAEIASLETPGPGTLGRVRAARETQEVR